MLEDLLIRRQVEGNSLYLIVHREDKWHGKETRPSLGLGSCDIFELNLKAEADSWSWKLMPEVKGQTKTQSWKLNIEANSWKLKLKAEAESWN
jgi:hypothetical protein